MRTARASCSSIHRSPPRSKETQMPRTWSGRSAATSICRARPAAPFTSPSATSRFTRSITQAPSATRSSCSRPPVSSGWSCAFSGGEGAP
eukprot:13717324-Alexandrium_andersonii.AAC.1